MLEETEAVHHPTFVTQVSAAADRAQQVHVLADLVRDLPGVTLSVRLRAGHIELDPTCWRMSPDFKRDRTRLSSPDDIRLRLYVSRLLVGTRTPAWHLPRSYWRNKGRAQDRGNANAHAMRVPCVPPGSWRHEHNQCSGAGQHGALQADVRLQITRNCQLLFPGVPNPTALPRDSYLRDEQDRLLVPHVCFTNEERPSHTHLTLQFLPFSLIGSNCNKNNNNLDQFETGHVTTWQERREFQRRLLFSQIGLQLHVDEVRRVVWFAHAERLLARMRLFGTLNHRQPQPGVLMQLDHHLRRLILSFAISLAVPYLTVTSVYHPKEK